MRVLVRGPALTRTGYGEHCRFVLRALRELASADIYLLPVKWGESNWVWENDEERRWLDEIIKKTAIYHQQQNNPQYDMSIQVTIPNEWQQMAPINIGITAGIETTKVAPVWLEKCNMMSKVITISNHSKQSFINTVYEGIDKNTGQKAQLRCNKDIDIVHYPVKTYDPVPMDLNLTTKFNFLTVAQWGPRKNMHATIAWFIEEFFDNPDVGLVVKTFIKGGSRIDKHHITKELKSLVKKYDKMQCKLYLLHGDLTDQEMHSLYNNDKIHCLVSLTHGEGFGLPLFEAAYSGLPVLATDWSGHTDFLYAPAKNKKTKNEKLKPFFAKVSYVLEQVPKNAVWDGVLESDSMWANPNPGSYKMKLREVYKQYGRYKSQAKKLKSWILQNFNSEKQHSLMLESIFGAEYLKVYAYKKVPKKDIPKISLITSVFKAEKYIDQLMEDVTSQTIFKEKCEWIILDVNKKADDYEEKIIKKYIDKFPDNIIYKRLDSDPGVYGVWNQAIEMSNGELITNVNCDDRRRPDAFEQQAKMLVLNSDVDLVYNDSYICQDANKLWKDVDQTTPRYNFEQFSKETLLRQNLPHNNPMWRRSIHEKNGYFNSDYRSAGDWDFWLKCAFGGSKFVKHPEVLGVYHFNPTGISTNPENNSWKQEEEKEVFMKYRNALINESNNALTAAV